ncbi:hypothetical protein VTO58DRAFT_108268 [Aureobasidium pullulans]
MESWSGTLTGTHLFWNGQRPKLEAMSSKFSFEYLLLPPRSALEAVLPGVTPKASSLTSTPAYSLQRRIYCSGEFIRQVSCYTLLSGFRLPWPPSCCLDELTPFVVSDERVFRHLNLAFGSSRIASSAYQKWPTSNDTFKCCFNPKASNHSLYLIKLKTLLLS